jgi:hypothetical protein
MHADGGTKASLIAMPDIAAVSSPDFGPMRGANVYVLINGKLGSITKTTPVDTVSILMRSVSSALKGESRASLVLAYAVAQRQSQMLEATAIPENYPFEGALDFAPATMRSLFEYGARCAMEGRVWDDAMNVLDRATREGELSADGSPPCPASDDAPR